VAVPLLLTTFAPWKAHQPSNASDDLVKLLIHGGRLPDDVVILRHIPVSFDLAPCRVISKTVELKPQVVVCCGMAEPRTHLELELNGKHPNRTLRTSLALQTLMAGTCLTRISHCAGDYVCNHLYYHLLEAITAQRLPTQALFIHVPLITPANQTWLVHDLSMILNRLARGETTQPTARAA
jgi:pyroglutamyl-peptidase